MEYPFELIISAGKDLTSIILSYQTKGEFVKISIVDEMNSSERILSF
jgi:hypothetical protein